MPRVARIVIPARPHHLTQRGNNRQDVFFVDADRCAYLELLGRYSARFGLSILGYCLMANHVHLIVVPRRADSLAKAVGRADYRYTQYINRLHGRVGHLWQNRFYSCPLDEQGFWSALRYVEQNPVRAGVLKQPWDWRWSSAGSHCGRPDESGLLAAADWERLRTGTGDWRKMLARRQASGEIETIRSRTHTGRPLASDSFLAKLERRLGRRLRALPVGRPRGRRKKK